MSSKTIYLENLQELISSKGFHVEFCLNSTKEKFIVIRNIKQGYRSVICVHPRYSLVSQSSEMIPIEPLSQITEQSLYAPLEDDDSAAGIYKETIQLSNINVETIMEIERYKKCLSTTQSFGLFFWGNGFIANLWYDYFTTYKIAESPKGSTMTIYSMIGIDNIVNWSSKTTENLETMVPKFYRILQGVSENNTNSTDEIIKHLRKLKEQKSELNKQLDNLQHQLKRTDEMIIQTGNNIESEESTIRINPGIDAGESFRKARARESLDKLYIARDKLFSTRDVITSRISSIYYNLDSVIYFSRKSISDLEKVLMDV